MEEPNINIQCIESTHKDWLIQMEQTTLANLEKILWCKNCKNECPKWCKHKAILKALEEHKQIYLQLLENEM